MYRTIAHLPPETLLRNEVTEVRPRDGAAVAPTAAATVVACQPRVVSGQRACGMVPCQRWLGTGLLTAVRVVHAGGLPLAILAAPASLCLGNPRPLRAAELTRCGGPARRALCWPSASRQAVPPGAQPAPCARAQASAMYAFGALLHRIAYGKRLHGEMSWAQALTAAKCAPLRPTLPPGVRAPPALMALMGCCLQREPSMRPSFAEARSPPSPPPRGAVFLTAHEACIPCMGVKTGAVGMQALIALVGCCLEMARKPGYAASAPAPEAARGAVRQVRGILGAMEDARKASPYPESYPPLSDEPAAHGEAADGGAAKAPDGALAIGAAAGEPVLRTKGGTAGAALTSPHRASDLFGPPAVLHGDAGETVTMRTVDSGLSDVSLHDGERGLKRLLGTEMQALPGVDLGGAGGERPRHASAEAPRAPLE